MERTVTTVINKTAMMFARICCTQIFFRLVIATKFEATANDVYIAAIISSDKQKEHFSYQFHLPAL